MLHGFPSYHTLPIPTCGFFKSSHDNPVAISIACEAPWLAGSVIRPEYLFIFFSFGVFSVAGVLVVIIVYCATAKPGTRPSRNGPIRQTPIMQFLTPAPQ